MAKPIVLKIVGDTANLERSLHGAQGKLKKFGAVAAKAFAGIGVAAGAAAIKGVTAFADFQGQMNEVFTLLPGISDDAMADMTGQVKDFAKEFGVLPDKVVPALYQSLSAGVPKDNVFEFLEVAQKAAKGGVTELETAVDGISSVVNAYGDDVVSATQASDLMFTAVRLGKTNFEELSSSLSNVTPIASGLGVKFEDVSAALAALTAKGVPTAQATTQMRSLFVELSKAGGKTATTFEKIAGKSFQEFIAEGGNTAEALAMMGGAASEWGVQIQDLFGSVEAGAAALSLASDSTFAENISEMGDAAGATSKAFDQMEKGLGPIFDKVKANLAVLFIDVGEKLAPIIEKAMERLTVAFAEVSKWWDRNGPQITAAVDRVMTPIVAAFEDFGKVAEKVISFVSKLFSSESKDMEGTAGRLSSIISSLVDLFRSTFEAIEAIVTQVAEAVSQVWDRMGKDIVRFITNAVDRIVVVIDGLVMILDGVIDFIKAVFTGDWKGAWDAIKQIFSGVWEAFGGIVDLAFETVRLAVITFFTTFTEMWQTGWNAAKTFVFDIWEKIKGTVMGAADALVTVFVKWSLPGLIIGHFGKIVDFVTGIPAKILGLKDQITYAAGAAFSGIKDAFKAVVNFIIDAWNRLDFGIDVSVPSWVPGVGGKGFKVDDFFPDIPRLARGGITTGPTVAMIGDNPSGREAVVPLERANKMGFGGSTYNVTVNALDPQQAAVAVVEALKAFNRTNGPVPVTVG